MIVLVDMDSVLADFEAGFLARLREKHPELPSIPLGQRVTFKVREQYVPLFGDYFGEIIKSIETENGFFRALPAVAGSIEAVLEIAKKNDVFITSSPLKEQKYSAPEKYEWIGINIGAEWKQRLILTYDKTLVKGDILIDDKPEIAGLAKPPQWEQVLIDWPYNRHVNGKRRINRDWSDWKEILPELV